MGAPARKSIPRGTIQKKGGSRQSVPRGTKKQPQEACDCFFVFVELIMAFSVFESTFWDIFYP